MFWGGARLYRLGLRRPRLRRGGALAWHLEFENTAIPGNLAAPQCWRSPQAARLRRESRKIKKKRDDDPVSKDMPRICMTAPSAPMHCPIRFGYPSVAKRSRLGCATSAWLSLRARMAGKGQGTKPAPRAIRSLPHDNHYPPSRKLTVSADHLAA